MVVKIFRNVYRSGGKKMKIVINRKFGGFSVSKEIAKELNLIDEWTLNRADKRLHIHR